MVAVELPDIMSGSMFEKYCLLEYWNGQLIWTFNELELKVKLKAFNESEASESKN